MQEVEPEFVGESRRLLVDGLVAVFDEVSAGSGPRWISLVAPSGWGKTRVAREFYARLASRQELPAYWPESILESTGVGTDLLAVESRRKRVVPAVMHAPGALPGYMWWGVSCSLRNGVPSVALAEDLAQFQAHAEYLEDAWRSEAALLMRLRPGAKDAGLALVDEAAGEVISNLAQAVVGAAVPGVGLVQWCAQRAVGAAQRANDRRRRLDKSSEISWDHIDLVDEVEVKVRQLAIPGLPVVIFVEDVHLADDALSGLLERLMSSSAAVMVLTTGHPGAVDQNSGLARALGAAPDRVVEFRHDRHRSVAPFPPGAGMDLLPGDALESIVRTYFAEVDVVTLEELVVRYNNPLALELFCQIPRIREAALTGPLRLTTEELNSLPQGVEELYRVLWVGLPPEVRRALTIATLGVPEVGDLGIGATYEWCVPVIVSLAAAMELDRSEPVASLLDQAAAYAWLRRLSPEMRCFNEPAQMLVAQSDDSFVGLKDRARAPEIVAAIAEEYFLRRRELEQGGAVVPTELDGVAPEHVARLMMSVDGRQESSSDAGRADAVLCLLEEMAPYPRELRASVQVADFGLERARSQSVDWMRVRVLRARALGELGSVSAAVEDLRGVVEFLTLELGPDSDEALLAAAELGHWLGEAGAEEEAVEILEDVLSRRERVFGLDHTATLAVRHRLVHQYFDVLRPDLAMETLEQYIEDCTRVLGPDDPTTVRAIWRYEFATAPERKSIALYQQELKRRVALEGERSQSAMETRNNLAIAFRNSGDMQAAIDIYEPLVRDRSDYFGPTHPRTLLVRNNLASCRGHQGRAEDAVSELNTVLEDHDEYFDPEHPGSLGLKHNLAWWLAQAGRNAEALQLFEAEVVPGRDRILGPLHRDSLTSRFHLSECYRRTGDFDYAADVQLVPVAAAEHAGEEFRPGPYAGRHLADYISQVADVLLDLGRDEEAVSALLDELMVRERGGDHGRDAKSARRKAVRAARRLGRTDAAKLIRRGESPDWPLLEPRTEPGAAEP